MVEKYESAQSGKVVIGIFLTLSIVVAAWVLVAGFRSWNEWRRQSISKPAVTDPPPEPVIPSSSTSP